MLYVWGEPVGPAWVEMVADTARPTGRDFVRFAHVTSVELYVERRLAEYDYRIHLETKLFGRGVGVVTNSAGQ